MHEHDCVGKKNIAQVYRLIIHSDFTAEPANIAA